MTHYRLQTEEGLPLFASENKDLLEATANYHLGDSAWQIKAYEGSPPPTIYFINDKIPSETSYAHLLETARKARQRAIIQFTYTGNGKITYYAQGKYGPVSGQGKHESDVREDAFKFFTEDQAQEVSDKLNFGEEYRTHKIIILEHNEQ